MRDKLQLTFRDFDEARVSTAFGGALLKGHPRKARPISLKRPLHLVLRSTLATGDRSFLRRHREIQTLIHRAARQQGIRLYRLANSGNHLHLLILARTRRTYRAFIRTVSGLIARLALGTQKTRPARQRFWDHRPFTRIVAWGRDYRQASAYLLQNTLEAHGLIPYRERRQTKPPPNP